MIFEGGICGNRLRRDEPEVAGFRLKLDFTSCDTVTLPSLLTSHDAAGFGAQPFYPLFLILSSEGETWQHTSEGLHRRPGLSNVQSVWEEVLIVRPSPSSSCKHAGVIPGLSHPGWRGKGLHFREGKAKIT